MLLIIILSLLNILKVFKTYSDSLKTIQQKEKLEFLFIKIPEHKKEAGTIHKRNFCIAFQLLNAYF